jgi:hypothetical protein
MPIWAGLLELAAMAQQHGAGLGSPTWARSPFPAREDGGARADGGRDGATSGGGREVGQGNERRRTRGWTK